MKIALVHDYIKEYGGAERVLRVLADMYPRAPIYTAFRIKGSTCDRQFSDKRIIESKLSFILKVWNLYSPLRFLTPAVWGSFDLSGYDVVIASSSWYITRGFKTGPKTKVVCYCHTPPRWLYGYETSVGFTKYKLVKAYALVVGHFMRIYDFKSSRKVNLWIANSENVRKRIKKFYRVNSRIIHPPVEVEKIKKATKNLKKENYFLIVSRLVGAKGIEEAVLAFKNSGYELKIVGESHGFSKVNESLKKISGDNISFLGRVNDRDLYELYGEAKGFIALARDEDFGMTVVEAQAAGTPVIAFNGGGFKESVIDGVTGILINDTDKKTIDKAVNKLCAKRWNKAVLRGNADKFSRENFERKIKNVVKD